GGRCGGVTRPGQRLARMTSPVSACTPASITCVKRKQFSARSSAVCSGRSTPYIPLVVSVPLQVGTRGRETTFHELLRRAQPKKAIKRSSDADGPRPDGH